MKVLFRLRARRKIRQLASKHKKTGERAFNWLKKRTTFEDKWVISETLLISPATDEAEHRVSSFVSLLLGSVAAETLTTMVTKDRGHGYRDERLHAIVYLGDQESRLYEQRTALVVGLVERATDPTIDKSSQLSAALRLSSFGLHAGSQSGRLYAQAEIALALETLYDLRRQDQDVQLLFETMAKYGAWTGHDVTAALARPGIFPKAVNWARLTCTLREMDEVRSANERAGDRQARERTT